MALRWLSRHLLGFTGSIIHWFTRHIGLYAAGMHWLPYRVDRPLVKSIADLRLLGECSNMAEDGSLEFEYCSFAFVTDDHVVYFGQTSIRKYQLTPEIINKSLNRVPDEDVYPEAPSDIIITEPNSNVFVKGPSLSYYPSFRGTGGVAKLLMDEATVLELLERNRHPNIMRYHGSWVHRGRIIGLVLERYPCTLEERMKEDSRTLDLELGFEGIKSGVKHLHSLELAHNDISPSNIMINMDTWILIDAGSCRPVGESLIMAGSVSWTTSSKQNDEVALDRLRNFLSLGSAKV